MNTVTPIIHTAIEYIKQLDPRDSSLFQSVAGFTSFFGSKPADSSGNKKESFDDGEEDGTGEDGTGEGDVVGEDGKGGDTPPGIINAIFAVIINPNGTTILNLVLVLFYYLLVLLLASFITNDLIFSHWTIRLFTFCFVVFLGSYTQTVVYPLAIYYIGMALYNGYLNFRDKPTEPHPLLPPHYAFLPIMTSRGGQFDFLNPFSYFPKGADDTSDAYHFFKKDEAVHKMRLDSLIPDFPTFSRSPIYKFPGLIETFNTYMDDLNKSFLKAEIKEPKKEEKDDGQAERDAIEQHITTAISKAAGVKTKEHIQTLGKPVVTGKPAVTGKPGSSATGKPLATGNPEATSKPGASV